jgi:hypothetical protein
VSFNLLSKLFKNQYPPTHTGKSGAQSKNRDVNPKQLHSQTPLQLVTHAVPRRDLVEMGVGPGGHGGRTGRVREGG